MAWALRQAWTGMMYTSARFRQSETAWVLMVAVRAGARPDGPHWMPSPQCGIWHIISA